MIFWTAGCSPVLSGRTDEAEWIRFRAGLPEPANRMPASGKVSDPGVLELRADLKRLAVRGMLLKCARNAAAEECYRKQLFQAFDDTYRDWLKGRVAPAVGVRELERQEFLGRNAWPVVASEIDRFHQGLLSGIEISARQRVKELVVTCQGSVPGLDEKSLRKCVDSSLQRDMDALLVQTAERLGIRFTARGAVEWIKLRQVGAIYEAELGRQLPGRVLAAQPEF